MTSQTHAPRRIRRVTQVTAAARLREHPTGADLLALRALANQPLRRLATLDPDPVTAWRHGEPAAIRTLAGLELRREGLRSPYPAPFANGTVFA